MFDIGGIELLIIGVLALVVVGPKELPRLIRSVSGVIRKVKALSSEFRSGLDDLAREVDIDPLKDIKDDIDPFSNLREEEGVTDDMSPEEVTEKILSNKEKKKTKSPVIEETEDD